MRWTGYPTERYNNLTACMVSLILVYGPLWSHGMIDQGEPFGIALLASNCQKAALDESFRGTSWPLDLCSYGSCNFDPC